MKHAEPSLSPNYSISKAMTELEFPDWLDLPLAWDQTVQWKHPVLPDGSLGPARGHVPRFNLNKLTKFTLFPKLPLDLRICIWRMAVDFGRVVRVFEDIEYPDSEFDDDHPREEEDENVRSIQGLDKELSRRRYFHNERQSQLETFGFISSRPAPELQTIPQLQHAANHLWETTRVGAFYSPGPLPVLLHVCRESRQLLHSSGYELAFSTRTAPAGTWFNFKSDILHLKEGHHKEDASYTLDGGTWNIGQFSQIDRCRLRKLSLSIAWVDYFKGAPVPTSLHKAVQLCGNLEELLIVKVDRHDMKRKSTYWYPGDDGGEIAVVDLDVEEYWGHHPGWRCENRFWATGRDSERVWPSHGDVAKGIEEQLGSQTPFFPDRNEWTTPKVRLVMLMTRNELGEFFRSREAFARDIDNKYWKFVAESRQSYRKPTPLDLEFRHGIEAEYDDLQWMSQYDEYRDCDWYNQAREAIFSVRGWPSPFTMEWIEANEARLDMDSWPWAEDLDWSQPF